MFDNDAAVRAAALFSRREGEDDEIPGVYAMTFRLPVSMAATISVMANHTGQSRNEMAQLIIRAGISAINAELPEDVLIELHQSVEDQISNFL
jgi:hypothetical protein